MSQEIYLYLSLGLNGIFLLATLLREPKAEADLQTQLFRAHQECQETDLRLRLGMSSDRAVARARWDATFREAWKRQVEDWKAEAERQGLTWLLPLEKGA